MDHDIYLLTNEYTASLCTGTGVSIG